MYLPLFFFNFLPVGKKVKMTMKGGAVVDTDSGQFNINGLL